VLPLLGDAAALLAARWRRQWSAWAPACIGGLLMAGGLWFMTNSLGFRPQYPLDRARLPIGVSAFLLQEGAGGRVFNVPTPGGYLEWKLSPRYQIFLDMQTMLFSPTDYFTALTAFSDKTVLERTLQRYYPGFLVAYEDDAAFRKTVAHFPHFVPVFFDDLVVLYADDRQYPDLVARFRLAHLDCGGLAGGRFRDHDSRRRGTRPWSSAGGCWRSIRKAWRPTPLRPRSCCPKGNPARPTPLPGRSWPISRTATWAMP